MVMDLFINALYFVGLSVVLVFVAALFISTTLDKEDK